MKKSFCLFLSFLMVFALAIPAIAADEPDTGLLLTTAVGDAPVEGVIPAPTEEDTPTPITDSVVVLYTNDVHCGIDDSIGYAGLAAYKAELEENGNTVTLVDIGDAIQGGTVGTLSKGEAIVDIMNEVGYDIAVPGNHEFDYGMDQFLALTEKAEYDYICCNFTDLEGTPVFDAYKIVGYGDVSVAFVGIDTPETFFKSTPTYFKNEEGEYIYSFCQGNEGADLYAAVQTAVDAARADGADYVIALGHLGTDAISAPMRSYDVIRNTRGIDVMLDGHSHSVIESELVQNMDGSNVLLSSTGTKLENIGCLVLDRDGEFSSRLLGDYETKNDEIQAVIDAANEKNDALTKQVVAKTEVDLVVNDPATGSRMVRSQETNLGDLCADAYRTLLGADIAFVNGGGVRASIPAGDITYGQIISVHPFGNMACLIEATGQQILDALEMGAMACPGELGGFLQVSGLTYEIHTAIPSSVETNEEGEFVKVAGEYRVQNVMVGEEPLDLEKTYMLASHNYMLKSGGDGFVMFKGDNVLQDEVKIDNQVLIDYIVDELGGVIGEDYADPYGQGRIKVTNAVGSFTDVAGADWFGAAVAKAVKNDLLKGTSETTFDPYGSLCRAMVVTVLWRAAGEPVVEDEIPFTDVEDGTWYTEAARWAVSEGIIPEAELFDAEHKVTREELATLLYSFEVSRGSGFNGAFMFPLNYADASEVSEDAFVPMLWCTMKGYFIGNELNQLLPAKNLTRAEFAVVLERFTENAETLKEAVSAEETPAEETPAEEVAPAEETPAEETPAEETPAEETPAEETPAEETPAEETPAEETPAEETPAE